MANKCQLFQNIFEPTEVISLGVRALTMIANVELMASGSIQRDLYDPKRRDFSLFFNRFDFHYSYIHFVVVSYLSYS